MGKRVLVIQGHPDQAPGHLCRSLEAAYARGVREAGHALRCIDVGARDFPLLRSEADWQNGALPAGLRQAQEDILWAQHIVRSGRLVVRMGMPAIIYKVYFRAHSVKSFRRNVLGFVRIAPVGDTLIGGVGDMKPRIAARWLDRLQALGGGAV